MSAERGDGGWVRDRWDTDRRGDHAGQRAGAVGGDDEHERDRAVLLARGVLRGRVLLRLEPHERGERVFQIGRAACREGEAGEEEGGAAGGGSGGDGQGSGEWWSGPAAGNGAG